jgi:hypothetical protein
MSSIKDFFRLIGMIIIYIVITAIYAYKILIALFSKTPWPPFIKQYKLSEKSKSWCDLIGGLVTFLFLIYQYVLVVK